MLRMYWHSWPRIVICFVEISSEWMEISEKATIPFFVIFPVSLDLLPLIQEDIIRRREITFLLQHLA